MITCDECQQKIAAVFDNEGSEDDENLISTHIEHCPDCQAFRAHIIEMKKALISAPIPSVSVELPKECSHESRSEKSNKVSSGTVYTSAKFRRLVWVSGLAATFIIVLSCLSCFILAREVMHLKSQLQDTQYQLALSQTETELKESHEREKEAIAILYYKMEELTKQVKDLSSPRTAYFQIDNASDGLGEM
jgi:hypothetical protein